MYNPRGHPRADVIASALSAASGDNKRQGFTQAQGDVEGLVALRYRGPSVLVDNVGTASDIEAK